MQERSKTSDMDDLDVIIKVGQLTQTRHHVGVSLLLRAVLRERVRGGRGGHQTDDFSRFLTQTNFFSSEVEQSLLVLGLFSVSGNFKYSST